MAERRESTAARTQSVLAPSAKMATECRCAALALNRVGFPLLFIGPRIHFDAAPKEPANPQRSRSVADRLAPTALQSSALHAATPNTISLPRVSRRTKNCSPRVNRLDDFGPASIRTHQGLKSVDSMYETHVTKMTSEGASATFFNASATGLAELRDMRATYVAERNQELAAPPYHEFFFKEQTISPDCARKQRDLWIFLYPMFSPPVEPI